jgi:energy-coupling factor transporter ATP-binding protein EcfA2
MGPAIEANTWGWRHAGRGKWALRGLDLVVEHGERVLLLGPSGAGKSTFLQALAGLLRAPEAGDEEGALLVDGQPAAEAAGRAGIVFQDPSSSIVMGRLGDEVAFGLENRGVPFGPIWSRVEGALAAVGLDYELSRPTDHLSGGEQQRLAIAGVLAVAPSIWLLDEPTANLDPEGAAMVRSTVHDVIAASGATLVLVEHRVSKLAELVDRVVVLEPGAGVAADGPPTELFAAKGASLRKTGVWTPGPPVARRAPRLPAGGPVVEAEQVVLRYRGSKTAAVHGVDLTAYAGQVLAVTGPNGSGKTTLALALASLMAPEAGEVRFLAGGPRLPYAKWPSRELVRFVGTVFQEPEHQFVSSTVAGELAVGPKRTRMESAGAKRRVGELLERLRLGELADANPFTLSGGEKRRLSVATALATEPRLLVLDEPTFGQDARTWDELVALLAEQRGEGRAVVTVTHDDELVSALADREVRLEAGLLTRPAAPGDEAAAPMAPGGVEVAGGISAETG